MGNASVSIFKNLTIGRCFAKCIEHNEVDGRTPESRCIVASFEYMERLTLDKDKDDLSNSIIDGGSKSLKFRVIDSTTTVCRLYKWTGSRENPENPALAAASHDKYYNPTTDPWRVGRWFSLLLPQCSISTSELNIEFNTKLLVW